MKKKYLILVLMLFLLTGCTAEYNLHITNNGIKEEIVGTVTNKELSNNENYTDVNDFSYYMHGKTPLIDDEGEYTKEVTDTKDGKKFKYTYLFISNYDKSNVLNTCFEKHLFKETEDYYYVELKGDFYCLLSDKININVTSDYGVIESNADKKKNNTYTWKIKEKEDNEIILKVSKNVFYSNGKYKENFPVLRIVGFCILAVLSVITYFIYKKNKDSI